MPKTYRAILLNGKVDWQDEGPPDRSALLVEVKVLAPATQPAMDERARGEVMAAALQRIADRGGIPAINDPVEWQREIRKDRVLPGRGA